MSWHELLELPEDVYTQASQMFQEEGERQREHERWVRSKSRIPFRSSVDSTPKPSRPVEDEKPAEDTEIDPKTGREMVKTVRPDGTTVRHRKIEEGDLFLWRLTGKVPKSWRGKVELPSGDKS